MSFTKSAENTYYCRYGLITEQCPFYQGKSIEVLPATFSIHILVYTYQQKQTVLFSLTLPQKNCETVSLLCTNIGKGEVRVLGQG